MSVEKLLEEWRLAKQVEIETANKRRRIEDTIKQILGVDENIEGVRSFAFADEILKITLRFDRKVDVEAVKAIAYQHGLEDWLEKLFRWKAKVEFRTWRSAPAQVTTILSPAITTRPKRATFSLEPQPETPQDAVERNNRI